MNKSRKTFLRRLASLVGGAALSMGVAVSTTLAAWNPITPDMFGNVPNYANSPLPVQVAAVAPTPTYIGNPLIARAYATDNASNVFVVNPNIIATAGNLTAFQAFAMTTAGLSTSSSLGKTFNAYVLRPSTTVPGSFDVVLDSGALTVPASLTADQVVDYPLGATFAVLPGDMIAFYGQGIPLDIGTGTDQVYYPANIAPTVGTTITLGTGDFPTLNQLRIYSFGAMVDVGGSPASLTGGMRKFVDSLPQLDTPNNLGQSLPVAVPDTATYPGSEYYEIAYVDYDQQLHSDLPGPCTTDTAGVTTCTGTATGTRLRGYVQLETTANAAISAHYDLGIHNGVQYWGVTKPQYVGPVIVAHGGKAGDPQTLPVRVKYVNLLPTGAGGDLFIPTDTTYMGAGDFTVSSDITDPASPTISGTFTQNRASTHLHGGATPWISDGTPHQWNTPAGEFTTQQIGVSFGDSKADAPDMWFVNGVALVGANDPDGCNLQLTCATPGATNDPGPGITTYYYTNQQSARLMFYHDHALGVTRLNVYAGMAGGYLETDPTEQAMISGGSIDYTDPVTGSPATATFTAGTLPDLGIPLLIQDKSFVPDAGDPTCGGAAQPACTTPGTYTNLVGTFDSQLDAQDPIWDPTNWGGFGQLWFPHVYMPNQNPYDLAGANAMGRWDYGPWFWPPFTGILYGEIANPYYDPTCVPTGTVSCEPPYMPGTPDARQIAPSGTPESFMDTGMVNGTAYPYIEVAPTVVRFRMLSVGNDRFFNLSLFVAADKNSSTTSGTTGAVLCDGTNAVNPADCTEVKMVPFNSSYDSTCPANPEGPGCFPSWWYTIVTNGFTFDDRAGGVPDPTTRGPAMIQVGTEGGFLPAPVVIRNQPVNYVYNRRDITVGNINEKALLLGPAERADVLVDFSQFAGKTLILYNDAPAPVPAADPRLDYYTGDPDQTDTGGAPSTLPGYGPNTRTVMQIRVRNTTPTNPSCIDPDTGATVTATQDCVSPIYTNLQTALPAAFVASQEPIIVPQTAYNDVYGLTTVDSTSDPTHNVSGTVVGIQDTSMTLTPIGQPQLTLDLQPKSIIEDFTLDYGRMNAILGVEVPHTNNTNQTSLLEAYMDPPTEMVRLTALNNTPAIGEAADGTQLWKITHNGVDTHAIHFHMFHVQLVNRVGWDGAIRLPDANELGWKDTVRMNPLEDVIVAMRPKTLELPFDVVNSWRPLDPAQQLGAQWQALEPTGTLGAVTITNTMTNFGWEHVWHCHLLGHEENDMMRALVIVEPPMDPNGLTATRVGSTAVLNWSDTSVNETSFTVLRDQGTGFVVLASLGANVTTYTDTNPGIGAVTYRVIASNTVGADPIAAPGYSQMTADSGPSNDATIPAIPVAGVAPTLLSFGNVEVGATSASQAVTVSNTGAATLTVNIGITGEYAQTNDCGAGVAVGGTCTINVTFSPLDLGTRLGSLSISTNDPVNPSFTVDLTGNGTVLFAPTGLAGTAVRIPGTQTENVTLTWTDNSLGEVNFELQRAQVNNRRQCNTTTAFSTLTTAIPALTGTGTVTYLDPAAPRQGSLCYRVRALSSVPAADSTWSNRAYVTTP